MYKEIEECLIMFQNTVSGRWKETLKNIEQKLNRPLFIDDAENHYTLTLDLQITNVIEEIRYLKLLKKDDFLTNEAILFNEKAGNLLQTRSLMASIVRWFNDLATNLVEFDY
ncbi:dynein axonemal heavy chain 11-like [Uloborus diversus]|uniref:dynein axonemal heavy chain 11-like n=1 Tax=Uloborus diversus TaxID=327109 RepID=UPI00240A18BF|nr:dynein axonemal heavy chain 11-like [Uloborus diversus]